jgi:hypothetical protein
MPTYTFVGLNSSDGGPATPTTQCFSCKKLLQVISVVLFLLVLIFFERAINMLWILNPLLLDCSNGVRPTNNYDHHVCLEEQIVKKKVKYKRLAVLYTGHQLETAYHNCPSTALSTPFLVTNGVAYYKRVDHHNVTPLLDANREALLALNQCAVDNNDCFYDLQSKNIHLDATGLVLIIDATIMPCWFLPSYPANNTDMTNLFGHALENYY